MIEVQYGRNLCMRPFSMPVGLAMLLNVIVDELPLPILVYVVSELIHALHSWAIDPSLG